jgi:Flp pilus assembly pilin Flp
MNPLNEPFVEYLRVLLGKRLAAARGGDGGASAIEWAIITGLLALIALAIFVIIKNKIVTSANNIKTGP